MSIGRPPRPNGTRSPTSCKRTLPDRTKRPRSLPAARYIRHKAATGGRGLGVAYNKSPPPHRHCAFPATTGRGFIARGDGASAVGVRGAWAGVALALVV